MQSLGPRVEAVSSAREEARGVIKKSISEMETLLTNWEEITKSGDGDEIRRRLGTVGKTSSLFKLPKTIE